MFGRYFNDGGPPRKPDQHQNLLPIEIQHGIALKAPVTAVKDAPTSKEIAEEILPCCASCGFTPPPGSFICESGHMTCMNCFDEEVGEGGAVCRFVTKKEDQDSFEFESVSVNSTSPCSKRLRRKPCYVHKVLFKLSNIECPVFPCEEVYRGGDIIEHLKTCVATENIRCPETECFETGLWNKEDLITHLHEDHGLAFHFLCERLFPVKPFWFGKPGISRATFLMKSKNNVWIGVASTEKIEGKDACVFILYHIVDADADYEYYEENRPKYRLVHGLAALGLEKRKTCFISKLKLRGDDAASENPTWTGASPTVYQSRDEILAAKQCLIFHADPKDVKYLELNLAEIPVDDPFKFPDYGWEPAKEQDKHKHNFGPCLIKQS